MKSLIATALILIFCNSASARLWQTASGKTLEAELSTVEGNLVVLKNPAGEMKSISVNRLCLADREFIQAWKMSNTKQVTLRPASGAKKVAGNTKSDAKHDKMRKLEMKAAMLINAEREEHGLKALKFDHKAADVARAHSTDMVKQDYFAHTAKDGRSPFQRLKDGKVKYSTAGENIAIHSSPEGAVTAWMNSPGHRANILNGRFGRSGMGICKKGGRLYLTQVFMN